MKFLILNINILFVIIYNIAISKACRFELLMELTILYSTLFEK